MSRSSRMLRLLQRRVPGTIVCKDVLVIPPTEHILRGFTFETTSTKNLVKFWRVVVPLYTPHRFLPLNHSDIIELVYIDPADYPKAADMLCGLIGNHIGSLTAICRPAEFFRFCLERGQSGPIWFDFEIGLTCYLIGNIPEHSKGYVPSQSR